MAQSEQEILAGLAEIVNEETGLARPTRRAGQVLHRRPRHRLAVDDDDRRQRRGEVRREDPRRRGQEPQDRRRRRHLHRQQPGLTHAGAAAGLAPHRAPAAPRPTASRQPAASARPIRTRSSQDP